MTSADQKKFKKVRARLADILSSSGDLIQRNQFIRVCGQFIAEYAWVTDQLAKVEGLPELTPAPQPEEALEEAAV